MKSFDIVAAALFVMLLFSKAAAEEPEPVFKVYPIGTVKRSGNKTYIEVGEKYKGGLAGLNEFSHVTVVYWFDRNDTPEKRNVLTTSRLSKGKKVGVFATHSPVRPNCIAISHCRIQSVKGSRVYIDDIDAFDGSPVIDLKCFVPYTYDKKDEVFKLPEWIKKVIKKNQHKRK